jgi:hypothetical protein
MRMKLLAAILTSGCLFGLQAPAFAQGASGLIFMPNHAYAQTPTALTRPFAQGRAGAFQSYDSYAGTREGARVSTRGRVRASAKLRDYE